MKILNINFPRTNHHVKEGFSKGRGAVGFGSKSAAAFITLNISLHASHLNSL